MYIISNIGIGSIALVSLISFVGGLFFLISKQKISRLLPYMVSLSVGALLGDSFIHLLPAAFESAPTASFVGFSIIAGFFFFLILEHGLHWHHSHGEDEHAHDHGSHIGPMITIADSLHNFIDGIIIALGFGVSVEVGIATTVAVILHEIPQEIGDMGLLVYAGWSKFKALVFNFISDCAAILGYFLVYIFSAQSIWFEASMPYLLAFAAGGFIYIAGADLIPELRRNHRAQFIKHIVVILAAIVAMSGLLLLE